MRDSQKNNPLQEPGSSFRSIDPCVVIVFGASGDLTGRRLVPAIYNLGREGLLSPNFALIGVARREKTNEAFRSEMKEEISAHSRVKPIEELFWKDFQEKIFYNVLEFDDDAGYRSLVDVLQTIEKRFATKGNRVFYLSVQPKYFSLIIEKLGQFGLIYRKSEEKWSRVIIEKPIGHDDVSAALLQTNISKHLDESQIYRIDHYLGKETVQNLLVFRFANSIFESLWNYRHIDHFQITVAEGIGIGSRGRFFEEEGLLRDIMQNHMMQLLSLVAMEPPVDLKADSVRDEKVKVLKAIRPFNTLDFEQNIIRGQYQSGFFNEQKVLGYRQEKDVDPQSNIETYLALRFYIDNWRWAGVPFYLRGGKRLPKRVTEIAVIFKNAPGVLFQQGSSQNEPNVLAIRIQPDEGISMKINCKVPGPSSPIQPVKMDFRYGSYFGLSAPEAYERLIWDCIVGDSTLFARSDEVAKSWEIFTPILKYWSEHSPKDLPNYPSGSWGPAVADEMIMRDGRSWRMP